MYKHEAEKNLEASNFTLKKAKKETREILSQSETEAERIIKDAKVEAKRILKEAKEDAIFVRSQSFDPKGHNKGA